MGKPHRQSQLATQAEPSLEVFALALMAALMPLAPAFFRLATPLELDPEARRSRVLDVDRRAVEMRMAALTAELRGLELMLRVIEDAQNYPTPPEKSIVYTGGALEQAADDFWKAYRIRFHDLLSKSRVMDDVCLEILKLNLPDEGKEAVWGAADIFQRLLSEAALAKTTPQKIDFLRRAIQQALQMVVLVESSVAGLTYRLFRVPP